MTIRTDILNRFNQQQGIMDVNTFFVAMGVIGAIAVYHDNKAVSALLRAAVASASIHLSVLPLLSLQHVDGHSR